ncbi:EIF5A [Acanthosepion pharaonis]|uniref:Eukaryotic translation initiation factor 5A n=1 Tax=Acanthosepion pharaonis TaxID=158019 RepID=A0A812D4X0_ACAPH|nr:EIF5A [Sepia pharaonis]
MSSFLFSSSAAHTRTQFSRLADVSRLFTKPFVWLKRILKQEMQELLKHSHSNAQACIVEMSTSKTGKHGHAKVHLVGLDLFTGKKYEDICPSTHNMLVPHVKRKDYLLVEIENDGSLSLMEDDGHLKTDLNCPSNELGKEIKERYENGESLTLTVMTAMDEEQVVGYKLDNK